jgi:hypothetical protein
VYALNKNTKGGLIFFFVGVEMPYKLRKAPNRDLYWVVAIDGQKKSKEPIPKERAEAQMRALYAVMRGGSKPSRSTFHTIADKAYDNKPPKEIDGFRLSFSTPTLKFYVKDKTVVVGIRGTASAEDVSADTTIALSRLDSTNRYKKDLKTLKTWQDNHRGHEFEYYGAGHSLGGAIMDRFIQAGLLKGGMSFNPAVELKNVRETIPNERIYNSNDALYKITSPLLKDKPEVVKDKPTIVDRMISKIPYLGTIYDKARSHFIGTLKGSGKTTITSQLTRLGLDPKKYLEEAKRRAKAHNYPYKLLGFSTDGIHKLALPDASGKIVRFGRVGYGDHIIYSALERLGEVPKGTASGKQSVFHKSHSKIKGSWRESPFSPNNLALKIIW